MAQYVKVVRSIWTNDEFVALSPEAQRVYFLLISQPDISHAGILPLLERRWARLAAGTTTSDVLGSIEELEAAQMIYVDHGTDEVLVRSYIRYDEMHRVPNGRKAVDKAIEAIISPRLRSIASEALEEARILSGAEPDDKGSSKGSNKGSGKGCATPGTAASTSTAPSTTPTTAAAAERPDEFTVAVVDSIIGLRLQNERNIRSPGAYRRKLESELPAEHGQRISELHDLFPTATASQIAAAVISGETRSLAPHARP